MNNKIWLSSPHMGGNEINYVNKAFESNWIAPLGPNVDNFEKDLCSFTGSKFAAALSSGTAAIHLALIQLGIKSGDEVICSTFTFSATVNPIIYQGAIPIFIDSEDLTWNMSPRLLEQAIVDRISKGKKPKVIILVHLYGMPAQMDEIIKVANHYEIPIIEDAAEALGSTYKAKALGTFGKVGILSFNGNKIITTSGGGALISDDDDFVKQSRFLATQARDNAPHYQHSQVGYNYRMSNISAGIGRGQMEVIAQRVEQRRNNYEFYLSKLSNLSSISFLQEPKEYYSNRWLSCILLKNYEERESLRIALEKENIESRPLWKPMHLQPIFERYPTYLDDTSENLFNQGLCLPSGSNLEKSQLNKVVDTIYKSIK
ncbi:MAG: DegT/DnrJ/EryC1/StrS family aminotransferase [Bacteroidota bacterium]